MAKFITDIKSTLKIGNTDKTLVKWSQQMIKDPAKFIRLARILKERTGTVGKVNNCNQGEQTGIFIR